MARDEEKNIRHARLTWYCSLAHEEWSDRPCLQQETPLHPKTTLVLILQVELLLLDLTGLQLLPSFQPSFSARGGIDSTSWYIGESVI